MTTPTDPPHEDTPVDGRVRALLWRLRARLVVPPDAQRVDQDLERILAAAAELRQVQPEAHLEGSQGAHGVGDRGGRGPIPISSTPEPVRLPRVESLAARRESKLPYSVSRVAAVAVLIMGVAGGLATAMDRDGTILALLGADSRSSIDTTESTTTADADIPDRDAAFDPSDGDDTDGGDGGADDGSSSAEEAETDETVEEPAQSEEPDDGATADGSSSSARTDGNGSEEEGTDEGERTGEEPVETVEDPDETVIAAPDPEDPGELDGFGGPTPCPEDSLRDCAPEDEEGSEEPPVTETADEDADESDGDDDDAADVVDAADRDPFKELASRRYRP